MGVVLPDEGFLPGLRSLTRADGALLVFDEVMTGFRVSSRRGTGPVRRRSDLSVLGKVIGGGLPVGAYGGRRDIMSMVAPAGPNVPGRHSFGNPLAMSAGIATLEELSVSGVWDRLEKNDRCAGRRPVPRRGESRAYRSR